MHKGIGLVLILLLFAAPAAAQKMKVYVDYDRDADLEAYTTFAWGPRIGLGPDMDDLAELAHAWAKNAIEHHLSQGGMIEDEENPQLYVTYLANQTEQHKTLVMTAGYNYGPGFYYDPFWGMTGAASVQRNTIPRGSLVIDIWDVEKKQLVWRGTATANVKDNPDPQKMVNRIDKAVEKIVKKFDSMRAKDLKK
jgi:hypothetical protein